MMRITDIRLRDFRSYEQLDLTVPGNLTVLVGPNAVGKTNIIEAVQLLTAGQTFRHARTADLLRHGTVGGRAQIELSDGNRQLETALVLGERSRRYLLNGKPKRVADIRGIAPSVTFTPDDLGLVKGSPAARRAALDALGVQLNRNYQVIVQDYLKVLQHKNRLLKDGFTEMLDALDEMYVKVAAQLQGYREALFAKLEPRIAMHYAHIAGGELLRGSYRASGQVAGKRATAEEEGYACELAALSEGERTAADLVNPAQPEEEHPPAPSADALAEAVAARRATELAARRVLVGPNHDRIEFTISGMDAGKFASQGQQRSVVLAWKLAEAEVIEEMLGTLPILLLDDVMSELDGQRRHALVAYLERDAQAFITTANLDYFEKKELLDAHVVKLPLKQA